MKKVILITIYSLCILAVHSQEKYFVNASSGLIIREEPSINASRIGKLPHGSLIEILETTKIKLQITDNGKAVNGVWVKVKFDNFPFIVSENKENLGYEEKGYVFSGFLEKLNKARIETTEIDSLKFYSLYEPPKSSNINKITSKKEVEKLLEGKVKWIENEYLERVIDEIILDNGQVLNINQKSNDYSFIAYYPTEKTILFEGGHSTDFSISIKKGESIETVGNPEYIAESPSKNFRLNGAFGGQECSSYFLQEKIGDKHIYLTAFDEIMCFLYKFSWLSDQEFVYCDASFALPEHGEQKYYLGKIIK